MNKQFKQLTQFIFIGLDILMLNLSIMLGYIFFTNQLSADEINHYIFFGLFINCCWFVFSFFLGIYTNKTIIDFENFMKNTIHVYVLWIVSCLFYLILNHQPHFSRLFILMCVFNFLIALLFNRFMYFGLKHYFTKQPYWRNNVLILGYNDTAKKLAHYFEDESINTHLLGFVDDEQNINELTHYPIHTNINNTITIAKKLGVQEIFSTIAPEQNKNIYPLIEEAENAFIRFKVVPNLSVFFTKPIVIDYINDLPILSLRADPLEDVANRAKKRVLDFVVSSLVIVFILSWLIPILGLLIVLESKGPIFFAQLRTGKNLQPFYCLKFRSMRINTDANEKQATKNDTRITAIGSFIRKTSLDEFPQFINVFKGEMSLVGPRPHMIKHTNDFSKIVDHYMLRQFLKPGITGWAQINSYRGEITNENQLKMRIASDVWYLEHWTIWLDIRIIFLTAFKVLMGDKQAY